MLKKGPNGIEKKIVIMKIITKKGKEGKKK